MATVCRTESMRGPKGPDPAPLQLNFYYALHSQISFVFLRYIKIHLSCWAFAFSGLSVSNAVQFLIQSLHSQLWSNIRFSEKTPRLFPVNRSSLFPLILQPQDFSDFLPISYYYTKLSHLYFLVYSLV